MTALSETALKEPTLSKRSTTMTNDHQKNKTTTKPLTKISYKEVLFESCEEFTITVEAKYLDNKLSSYLASVSNRLSGEVYFVERNNARDAYLAASLELRF